ncbi:hypothetical protein FQN54_002200 [Arachnomyces sp. PD_36]|nr:hypothetical protein FQN54_002200 [Arachnomyces sp. PD_36]
MALRAMSVPPFAPRIFPNLLSTSTTLSSTAGPVSRLSQLSASISPSILGATITLNVPSFLTDIWGSILRAVPKKKTSHMKKRHRQMAGKALKDVRNINTCSGCGKPKRAHLLCPDCVGNIRELWREADKESPATAS